jgi:uridylate kinase
VYSADPEIHKDAEKYETLSYDEVIDKKLGVMDLTAICLSRDHDIPIKVFNMTRPGALLDNVMGKPDGTMIQSGQRSG